MALRYSDLVSRDMRNSEADVTFEGPAVQEFCDAIAQTLFWPRGQPDGTPWIGGDTVLGQLRTAKRIIGRRYSSSKVASEVFGRFGGRDWIPEY